MFAIEPFAHGFTLFYWNAVNHIFILVHSQACQFIESLD